MKTRTELLLLCGSLMLAMLLAAGANPSAAAPAVPQAGQWEITTIEGLPKTQSNGVTAIDLNSQGLHQVAYYYEYPSGDQVRLARETHGGWVVEQVNPSATWGIALDLVIDGDDTAVVTYHTNGDNLVYSECYASNCSGAYAFVPSGYRAGQETLARTSDGRAAIGFGVAGGILLQDGKLYTGTFDPPPVDGWNVIDVGAPGLTVGGVAMALDDQDYPALAYLTDDTMVVDVSFAAYDGAAWFFDNVTEQEEGAAAPSGQAIDLDEWGNAVISYVDGEGKVRLAQRPSGGGVPWNIQLVDNGPANDRTALSYVNGSKALVAFTGGGLKVANKGGGGGWSTATVDPLGRWGLDLVMDRLGYPHLSYYAGNGTVRVAVYAVRSVDLQPAQATIEALAGSDVTYALQLTNTGNVLDTYAISADNPWRTAVAEPGDVTLAPGETVELLVHVAVPQTAVGGDTDITEVTVTSQADAAITASAALTTAIQPGEWLISSAGAAVDGMHPAVALYPDGLPLISSVGQADTLRRTWLGAGGWQVLPVLSGADAQVNTEVRVGSDGLPAIAFAAAEGGAASVARRGAGGAWTTTAVPGSAGVIDLGLALDGDDFPHLAFTDWNAWYAYLDPTGWHGYSDPDWRSYYRADIALDSQGKPHAAYYYGFLYTGQIVYLRQEQGGWVTTEIVIGGDSNLFDIAIAVTEDDKPVIAYSEPENMAAGLLQLKQGEWIDTSLAEGDVAYGIGLDTADGKTAVCFQQDGPRYAEVWPHGWVITPVADQAATGCSLALAADGRPGLVYRDTATAAIHYATLGSAGLQLAGLRPAVGLPGSSVTHTVWITNKGTVPDSFALAVSGAWPASAPDGVGPLAPGESAPLEITVAIPAGAELGATAVHDLLLTSVLAPEQVVSAELVTRAAEPVLYLPAVAR